MGPHPVAYVFWGYFINHSWQLFQQREMNRCWHVFETRNILVANSGKCVLLSFEITDLFLLVTSDKSRIH